MLRAIVVDDEILSARLIKKYLEDSGEVHVVEVLSNPLMVVEEVKRNPIDVVFLDIEMPQRSGLEIAQDLTMLDEPIEIVFITAFNAYAIEAFKVNALDYILKPVQTYELDRVIGKIKKKVQWNENLLRQKMTYMKNIEIMEADTSILHIATLGGFSSYVQGGEEEVHWSTAKCSELLAYMLFQKENIYVSKWKLMDILWPGKDDEKSAINLRSTVCRLNKTLREHGINGGIVAKKNTYYLDLPKVEVDAFFLEQYAKSEKSAELNLEEFISLYPGELFKNLDYEWALGLRTHYMRVFLHFGKEIVHNRLTKNSDRLVTLQMLEYLLQVDMYNEELQEQLLTVLYQLEGKKAVIECEERFERLLEEEVGVKPTLKLKKAYEALLALK